MAAPSTHRIRPGKSKGAEGKTRKRKRGDVQVEDLAQAVHNLDTSAKVAKFDNLPLSAPTRAGLGAAHFTDLTPIQSRTIPLALQGRDILGAAKTGSGKTLAFIVPVLENLYRSQSVGVDAGCCAMIISPTRELAIQIFDVLVKVGKKGHQFSAGLVIGGKGLSEERDALVRMNIVVCTPGRMLQHLSQTAMFNCDNLQMLVLDEADRIMDMGFQRDVDAIVEYLPPQRQTLLFSATQTKKVSDLARLSLKDPDYISTSEVSENQTPITLQQNYLVTPLSDKLDTLWSFLQTAKKTKIIVFLSSAKQVRFVYEAFRHMQPGIPLLHLHGRQKQTARLDITSRFSAAQHSCLFATDVAARGLDFPAVDWVVQVDCPEDVDTYIHRVGRTARYERDGRAVLFLDPSEEAGMVEKLATKKIPIERINVRQKKQTSIKPQLQNMCFKDPTLKYLGQKAFVSYAKSIYLRQDKNIFKLNELALEEYAASLGLPGAPKIKFIKGDDAKARKNAPRMGALSADESGDDEDIEKKAIPDKSASVRTKYDRMFERQNQDVLAKHYANLIENGEEEAQDSDSADQLNGAQINDDDLFAVKRRIPVDDLEVSSSEEETPELNLGGKSVSIPGAKTPLILDSKRREKLLKSKKKLLKLKDKGTKLVFDDDGNAHPIYELEDEEQFRAAGAAEEQRRRFVEEEGRRVKEADLDDKEAAREKKRDRKEKRKAREREQEEEEAAVTAGGKEDVLANFAADAASSDDESRGEEEVEEARVEPEGKRQKKWFEEEGKAMKKRRIAEEAPETLEDLEALASGLLG